jgi:hypothetical protein
MSGVFRNIDPPPPHRPASVYLPPLVRGGEDTLAGWRGGGGSIVRKMPDTALYSAYVSNLWCYLSSSSEKAKNLRKVFDCASSKWKGLMAVRKKMIEKKFMVF